MALYRYAFLSPTTGAFVSQQNQAVLYGLELNPALLQSFQKLLMALKSVNSFILDELSG